MIPVEKSVLEATRWKCDARHLSYTYARWHEPMGTAYGCDQRHLTIPFHKKSRSDMGHCLNLHNTIRFARWFFFFQSFSKPTKYRQMSNPQDHGEVSLENIITRKLITWSQKYLVKIHGKLIIVRNFFDFFQRIMGVTV